MMVNLLGRNGMGTDIEMYVERLEEDGWTTKAKLIIDRNYALFAVLAGVRNNEEHPFPVIAPPRGRLKDLGIWTEYDEYDCHSASWFLVSELLEHESLLESVNFEELSWIKVLDPDPKKIRIIFWFDC